MVAKAALVPTGVHAAPPSRCAPTPITLTEAEILAYLAPESVQTRSSGRDVVWEQITSNKWNQKDYFQFQIFVAGPVPRGSIAWVLGNYAVNKHTADILDVSGEYRLITSKQLRGVQTILRREHCIDAKTIQKFRYTNPEAHGAKLSPGDISQPK